MSLHASTAIASRPNFRADAAQKRDPVDPIFAIIESHRQQHAAHGAAVDADKEREASRARNAAFAVAMALVKAPATTLPGVIALLQYGYDFVRDGNEWPNWIENAPYDWSAHLNKSAARALEKIALV